MRTQQRFQILVLNTLALGLLLNAQPSLADELTITTTTIPQTYTLDATIEALNAGTISAQTNGVIKAIYGDVNQAVTEGVLLVEIDNIQQKAAVAQAEASLAQAKALNDDAQATLTRNTRLHKQGTLSKGEYDRALAQAKSAAANAQAISASLVQAQAQLSYTRVIAPYAGVVTERFVEVGELVSQGQPLMSGYQPSAMRAVVNLPQYLASQYTSESSLDLTINGATYSPTETTLFPFADPQVHSVRLRATLPSYAATKVIPGQWIKVTITTGTREGIALPAQAVMHVIGSIPTR
jgi:RND family efflux transporter MFP subunit